MKDPRLLLLAESSADANAVAETLRRHDLRAELLAVRRPEEFRAALLDPLEIVLCGRAGALSALDALHETRAARPDTPVLVYADAADPTEARTALSTGASGYVQKGDPAHLVSSLRPLLSMIACRREAERLARHEQRLERLVNAVQELSRARSLEAIREIVRHAARELAGADGATFVLREGEKCHYVDEDAIAPLWKGQRFPLTSCISGWAMLHRQPAVIPDIYKDPRIPHDAYRPTFVKSLVMVPIRDRDPLGAIGTYWATPHAASEHEVAVLRALANTTSVAMENVRVYAELEERVRERTQRLEAANRELETFSYSVAHDLRAPLRAINSFAVVLSELSDDARITDIASRIGRAGERMSRLVDDLLRLAQISRKAVSPEQVDLSALARAVLESLQASHPQRAVAIHVHETPPAFADAGLLLVVLENLLGNAWKFTGKLRPAQARIEFGSVAGRQPVTYFVRDNGVGFDATHASGLFTPFFRMHGETEFPGSGIGLATVQRIVERHGGRTWVEAMPDRGATFYFTLESTPTLTEEPAITAAGTR